ncbi:MAG: hypothetical protein JSV03_11055 [Planctomycetota bacterium]|nr:MAG: hypothetical protein JSV03_11055 [Planctomycetota bacterium]
MSFNHRVHTTIAITCLTSLALATAGYGQNLEGAPVPPSPFVNPVYKYMETMVKHGRDTYGPEKTGLFLSALDRKTLKPLETRPPAPAGVREIDRPGPKGGPLVGANLQLDQNLIRLLYFFGWRGEEEPKAADQALIWFLKNAQSPTTGLLPWGEHLSWNVMTDQVASGVSTPMHEFSRPWLLWEKCFELAPEESRKFALGLWNSQVANHDTGAFDRHAPLNKSAPRDGMDFPRHAGFYIRTWAEAYAHTEDQTFLMAIEVMLTRFENKRHPETGLIEFKKGSSKYVPASSLSMAIDCDGAARKVPEPLATRLANFAAREDEIFCSLPHDLKNRKGFVRQAEKASVKLIDEYTPLWQAKYGGNTTAMMGMMCVSRYENTGKVCYRDLIAAAADAYLDSLPAENVDAWPMTFGHAISLQLAAFRATAQEKYHHRAYVLGEFAMKNFWGDNPLPRASLKTDHYESITGADTLVLALEELHLSTLHITAIRAPVNTIDR